MKDRDCATYERHERGQLADAEYQAHAAACPDCQRLLESDRRLLALAGQLRPPAADSALLWPRVEEALQAQARGASRRGWWRHRAWKVAAVLLVAVAGALVLHGSLAQRDTGDGLLPEASLRQVEEREREYAKAIEALERQVRPAAPRLDVDLMRAYEEKLAVVDEQIAACRRAASQNRTNAHVRRYLLVALQSKRQTLLEIAQLARDAGDSQEVEEDDASQG